MMNLSDPDNFHVLAMIQCSECRGLGCNACKQKGTHTLGISLPQFMKICREYLAADPEAQAPTADPEAQAPTADPEAPGR